MSAQQLQNVVAHWATLADGFQTSVQDFYATVEKALDRRSIPGVKLSRVRWSESGPISPDREYLRVEGDRYCVDLCAAPFGSGFFFSSWTTTRKARFVMFYLAWVAALTAVFSFVLWALGRPLVGGTSLGFLLSSILNPVLLAPLGFLLALWVIAVTARAGAVAPELAILTVPLIGGLYARLFAPVTFYRLDTMQMFHSAVHAALLEAIDGEFGRRGLRALSADERKPVFKEMLMATGAVRATGTPGGHPIADGSSGSEVSGNHEAVARAQAHADQLAPERVGATSHGEAESWRERRSW